MPCRAVIGSGTAWPARNNTQVELAELICERVPSIDLVRFCNSGSEANMLALHVARTHTGRHKMLMAQFGYHGSHEAFEAGYFGNTGDKAWPHTIVAPWGDAAAFESILAEQGDEIAAVFLEGAMGASGLVQAPTRVLPARDRRNASRRRGVRARRGHHVATLDRRPSGEPRHHSRSDDVGKDHRRWLPGRRGRRSRRPDEPARPDVAVASFTAERSTAIR